MEITEVRVFPVDEEKLRAYASIVLDRCFIVNDLKVIQGKKGLFISMPSRRRKRGGYRDVAHPLNNETRQLIEERVLGEYERVLGEEGAGLRLRHPDEFDDELAGDPQALIASVASQRPQAAPAAAAPAEEELPAPAPTAATEGAGEPDVPEGEDKSLAEVEEMHLRDSFWSVS